MDNALIVALRDPIAKIKIVLVVDNSVKIVTYMAVINVKEDFSYFPTKLVFNHVQ